MYWLDNNTGIPTAPTPPAVISATKRYFTNGGQGVQPSTPEEFWFNMVTDELLAVLTMAGVTPAKNDLGQVAKAIQSIAFSAYPVGAPIPWPTAVPPAGFIAMTGQSFSAATYPKLALAYPALVLPDMRAEFIRGWDNARGVDTARAMLSAQSDAIRNITGGLANVYTADPNSMSGALSFSGAGASSLGTGAVNVQFRNVNLNASTTVPTAAENRPRNTAFNYIVRAA